MPLTHRDLGQLEELLLGFPAAQGICHGFSGMLVQAAIAGDLKSFFARLRLILSYKGRFDELLIKINQAKDKSKARKRLSKEDRQFLAIPAFFEGVMLYLHPSNYPDFFNGLHLSQCNMKEIFSLIRCEKLQSAYLKVLLNKSYAFNKRELITYLENLKTLLKKDTPIILSSNGHAVFLSFDHEKGEWIYVDINYLSRLNQGFKLTSTREVANRIFRSAEENSGYPKVLFNTRVFANNPSVLQQQAFEFFDKQYQLSQDLVNLHSSQNSTLLHLACRFGNQNEFNTILNYAVDVNESDKRGLTPLYLASQNGHSEIVNALVIRTDIEVNRTSMGATPLCVASQQGHTEVVQVLLTHRDIEIDKTYLDFTPLSMALQGRHFAIASLLLEHGANEEDLITASAQKGLADLLQARITAIQVNFDSLSGQAMTQAQKGYALSVLDACLRSKTYYVLDAQQKANLLTLAAIKRQQIDAAADLPPERLKILATMQFDKHLVGFIAKASELEKKARVNPNYKKAAGVAENLYLDLEKAKEQFLQADKTVEQFKQDCQEAMNQARPILELHREWGGAIKKFLFDLLSCLSRGLLHGGLFAKTDSARKLDAFQEGLMADSIQHKGFAVHSYLVI